MACVSFLALTQSSDINNAATARSGSFNQRMENLHHTIAGLEGYKQVVVMVGRNDVARDAPLGQGSADDCNGTHCIQRWVHIQPYPCALELETQGSRIGLVTRADQGQLFRLSERCDGTKARRHLMRAAVNVGSGLSTGDMRLRSVLRSHSAGILSYIFYVLTVAHSLCSLEW